MSELLNAALEYAAAGFRIFPLKERDKKPLPGTHGCTDGKSDASAVKEWWANYPRANIGICTGKAANGKYLAVIDLDIDEVKNKHGDEELLRYCSENDVQFPDTLTAITGRGGRHLFYYTDEEIRNTTDLLPGIDVRGEGGYIVAAPSIHPNGTGYRWTDGFHPEKIAQADEAVLAFLHQKKQKAKSDLPNLQAEARKRRKPEPLPLDPLDRVISSLALDFSQGTRNDSLFKLAASLQARGFEDNEIKRLVSRANSERCTPSIEQSELDTIINSALSRYTKGIPKTLDSIGGNFAAYEEKLAKKYPFIIPKQDATGNISYTVSAPQLAEYIRKTEHYFFLDTGGEKPLLFIYSGGCYKHRSDNDFKSMIKKPIEDFDKNLVRSRDLDEVFKLLSTDQKTVKANELDADEEIINFQNGLLNIRTLELFPHSPEILSTVQRPCNWNPKAASCPTFQKYLDDLTADEDEQNAFESKMLLLQFLGLIISNVRGYRTKKALFLVGAGNSGKSQFLELAARLVGDENFASVDLQSLEERFGTAAIWRKRLVGAPDMSYQRVSEMKLFKKITGGDRIDFEFKGRDRFTDVFRGVLVFCCNALPKFGGDRGRHVYERMLVLPCDNVIPEEQRDPNIIEKLFDEREGIVYNAVLCLKQLVEGHFRFTIPKKSVDVLENHAVENDSVLRFLQECTEPRDKIADSEPTKGRIYQTFKNWATDAREYIPTKADFNQSIAQKYGVPDVKSITAKVHGNEFYRPFRLTKQALEDYGY